MRLVILSALLCAFPFIMVHAQTASPLPNPFPPSRPEDLGIAPGVLEEMSARVRGWIEQEDAVGAELVVIKNRRTVLHEVYGLRDLEDETPVVPETIVCIRSMTKPVVGTAIQILVDEARLSLDDTAAKYLPSFANARSERVTVRQLLTHTAGFPITLIDRELSMYKSHQEVVEQAGTIGPSLPPGEFSYSDSGVEALTEIVSRVAGEPAERFIKRRILDPLGMSSTYTTLDSNPRLRARVSSNHAGGPAAWHKYWDNDAAPLFPFFLGAAGMYSTVSDYAKFLAMWMGGGRAPSGRVLSEDAVRRALEPTVAMIMPGGPGVPATRFPNVQVFYGQLWSIYKGVPAAPGALPAFGHSGSDGTAAWAFPDQDLIVLLFTQSRGGLSVLRFERFMAPLVGLQAPDVPTLVQPSADDMSALPGTYVKGSDRVFVVRQRNRLAVQLRQGSVALRWPDPQGRWAFDGLGGGMLRFVRDDQGKPTAFELLGGPSPKVFQRRDPSADVISAKDLMELRRRKQGGDSIDRLRSVELTGTLTIGQASGPVTVLAAADGSLASRVQIGTAEETTELAHGRGHKNHSITGRTELTGAFLEQVQLASPLIRIADWQRIYQRVEVVGREKLDAVDVWVVRVTPRYLPPATRYVAVETGLLVKDDGWLTVKGVGVVPFTTTYGDYRPVSGVLLPFHTESSSGLTGNQVVQWTVAQPLP
jgi:CubicO group peptidase (beta-lactamase class C family)